MTDLLALSPLLGAVLVWRSRRRDASFCRQIATVNAVVTAALATWLVTTISQPMTITTIRWFSVPSVSADVPWLTLSLTFGIDHLNAIPLLVIAWLTLSVLMAVGRSVSAWELIAVLAWESAWLAVFLAQDAFTFWIAAEGCALLAWSITVGFGTNERRPAAGKLWRQHVAANALVLSGLIGLTVVGAWMQRAVSSRSLTLTGSWRDLTELTPRLALSSADPAQTWQTVSMGLLLLVLIGAWIRCGLFPLHGWWTTWLTAAPSSAASLGVVAWPMLGVYTMQRCVLPVFPIEWRAVSAGFGVLGAAAAVWGGLLALAQTDPRKFAAAVGVSFMGLIWLGLTQADPLSREAAVTGGLASFLGIAGVVLWIGLLEQRADTRDVEVHGGLATRSPRLAAIVCLLLLGTCGVPALARIPHEPALVRALLQSDPWSLAAWACTMLLIGWSSFWLVERIVFARPVTSRPEDPLASSWDSSPQIIEAERSTADLSPREAWAFVPIVVGMVVLVLLGGMSQHRTARMAPEQRLPRESP